MRHIVGVTAWRSVDVQVDGVPVEGWWEADDQEGYVLIPAKDADGIPGTDDDDQIVMTRIDGRVTFTPAEVPHG
jgi:hypothetical protein